ncbi:hypothetical protein TRIUR3_01848 [Triticum urartu]|uniref:DUF4220 domain-containing protein n=1 Tax=Triticum urartu TaxID=4572 RepID=M7ZM65_TRIUA|nr:hypothetical protein TRIUR3_01848 [Triticum urartu]
MSKQHFRGFVHTPKQEASTYTSRDQGIVAHPQVVQIERWRTEGSSADGLGGWILQKMEEGGVDGEERVEEERGREKSLQRFCAMCSHTLGCVGYDWEKRESGHWSLMAGVMRLWNGWGVQNLVLVSFVLQVFLLMLAGMRRRNISIVPRNLLWLAYLLADYIAVYILGHMTFFGKSHVHQQLMAFWVLDFVT